jgi:hypothetical protein
MSRKITGLLVMVFALLLGGFLTLISVGIVILRWRAPEYEGYAGDLRIALGFAIAAIVAFSLYKIGVRIADRLPS